MTNDRKSDSIAKKQAFLAERCTVLSKRQIDLKHFDL